MSIGGVGRLAGKAIGGIADNVGVLGLVGGGLDTASGLMSGEDAGRAGAGAIGGTVGGGVGAAVGRQLFKKVPIVGSLVGGYLGGTVGGYMADRGDDALRGEQQTNQVILPVDLEDAGDILKAANQAGVGKYVGRLAGMIAR